VEFRRLSVGPFRRYGTHSMNARVVAVLGATGSIGSSALDVIARHPERFRLGAVAAHRNWKALLDICLRFRPQLAALLDPDAAGLLERELRSRGARTDVASGESALVAVGTFPDADTIIAAIVGAAGLVPTLAAARAGKRILLANKEALIVGGEVFLRAAAAGGAKLLPVDSEHNAIFQCLPPTYARDPHALGVRRLLLTASGGPFRNRPLSSLREVTPEEACAHPNWSMGRKISVDSATMMNKGLEVIEAHRLFGVAPEAIGVVVHPQSIVHSLVEYVDGSVLAQLGQPDMRTPIAQALAFPDRVDAGVAVLDLVARGRLEFEALDDERFPCVGLAFDALRAGDHAPVVLNAANEVAVAAFLERRIAFTDIHRALRTVLDATAPFELRSIEDALECDRRARRDAAAVLGLEHGASAGHRV
jgi:1-deoxy-D-xylulose-5-phosphate reductoisomerase